MNRALTAAVPGGLLAAGAWVALVAVAVLSATAAPPAAAQNGSAVSIELLINGQPADSGPGPTVNAGDTLTLDYVITVSGSDELYDLAVRDTAGSEPDCDTNGDGDPDGFWVHPGPLSNGAIFTCSATITAQASDASVAIIATVAATDFDGAQEFDAQDPAHYTPRSPDPTTTAAPASTTTTAAPTTTAPPAPTAPPAGAGDVNDDRDELPFDDEQTSAEEPPSGDDERTEKSRDEVNPPPGPAVAELDVEVLLDTDHELVDLSGGGDGGTGDGQAGAGIAPPLRRVTADPETDLTWTYLVINSGTIALEDVVLSVTEIDRDGNRRVQPVVCPWDDSGTLPPGRSLRCAATTPAPLTPGSMTVSATVRAVPVSGGSGSDGRSASGQPQTGRPIESTAGLDVTIEGIDGLAYAGSRSTLFGFGIAAALLAAASLALWLLAGKSDPDHELP